MMLSVRKTLLCVIVSLVLLTVFAACGGAVSQPEPANPTTTSADATITALKKLITFVGNPTVKAGTGTTFEVDGQVKNGDSQQHDIFVKAILLNAAGKDIGNATMNVDNVAGGATQSFAISVTTSEPTWKTVQVMVTKVTENVGGSGQD